MKKITSKMITVLVSTMMLMSAFLIPGLFNFDAIKAESGFENVEVEFQFGGDNNLISGSPSNNWVKMVDSDAKVATVTSSDGKVVITINDWVITGSGDSVLNITVTGNNVSLRNISAAVATQSKGKGGDSVANIDLSEGITRNLVVGNKLNFISFSMDVYDNFTLSYVTNMEDLQYPNEVFNVGDSISAPTPSVDGFIFLGWFTDAEFTTEFTAFGSMPANDVTVYGEWEEDVINDPQPETFTLTYVSNQETVTLDPVSFEEGDDISAPTPSVDGFTFLGWFTDAEFTTEFTAFGSMPANDVTVYADWGQVLGDEDESVEDEEEVSEDDELEDDGEVLGDSDETEEETLIPDMSDSERTIHIGLFFLIIGMLTIIASKKEEELV